MRAELADGRVLEFPDGTDPAVIQATVQKMLSQPAQPDAEPPADNFFGASVIEPAAAIASGIGSEIAGGLAGLVTAPIAGSEQATENIQSIKEAGTYQPRTEAGQAGLQTVGDLVQAGVDLVNFPISGLAGLSELITGQGVEQAAKTVQNVQEKGVGKAAGDRAFEITGDPLLSAIAETSPAIVTSLVPLTKIAKTQSALKAKLADQIKAGSTDKSLVNYMINGAGKLKTDKVAQETVKQGFDQGVISAVKGATQVDRAKMSTMVDVMQKGKGNSLYALKNRPSDVAGNSLLDRVKYIKDINRTAGKQIDEVAKTLKGKTADFDTPVNNFLNNLDEMGIKLDKRLRPNFKGSDVEGLAAPQSAIANITKRLSSGRKGVQPDAHEMHRMKRFIDENVTYGKAGEGLTGKTERILKKLRVDLDDALDSKFPEYNKVNTTYSDTIGALDGLQDVAGRKLDLFGPNADKATGTLLRRMMSNVQSRVNLVDAVDGLEDISKKYGATFNDDIATQMLFADELDNVFGPVARTSLAGEAAKGFKKGAEAVSGQRTIAGAAIEAGAAGVEKLRGINETNAFKSITELLKRE
jgi:hypothetical protein